jgi:hypothetical protein
VSAPDGGAASVAASPIQPSVFKEDPPMKSRIALVLLTLAALLGGCAGTPQAPVPISKELLSSKTVKVGVAMSILPKVDTEFPGAGCLLCLATASLANQSLSAHVRTLSSDELAPLKDEVAKLLRGQGMEAKAIDEPLDVKKLPGFSSKEPNFAKRDHASLKAKYGLDKLLVIDITALGAWRNYSAYIPTGDPKAVLKGSGYIVNLSNNALDWYLPLDIQKSAEQKWDEPPKFPGLTNAYYQALEGGKDAILKALAP